MLLVRATKSQQIERVQFVATLSPGRNFVRYCRRNRQLGDNVTGFGDNVAGFGDNVTVFGDIVVGVDGTIGDNVAGFGDNVADFGDIVAGVDGALVLDACAIIAFDLCF